MDERSKRAQMERKRRKRKFQAFSDDSTDRL